MNTVTVRILTFLLSVFVIVTVFSQIYIALNEKYVTETAMSYSSATKETFYGIFVRDETTIKYSGGGSVSYSVPDGSKVANNAVVACVYSSDEDIRVNSAVDKLTSEINLLESAQSPGTTEKAHPDFMSKLIDEEYQHIASGLAGEDLSELAGNRDNFLSLMSIYQIAIGESRNYDDRLDELYQQLNIYKGRQRSPLREVTADSTGYFVSYTDGYENILNTGNITELTAADIDSIIKTETSGGKGGANGEIGKLIDGYDWKMIGIINNSDAAYAGGDSVKLRFSSTSDVVQAKIESITDTDDPERSIVIVSCDQLTFDLVRRRVERVDMILHDYDGIKVPRAALRFDKDNNKGVFVLLGQRVMFKKIDVIFECDDYLLSRKTSDSGYLSIYEDIVISGVDTAGYYEALRAEEEERLREEEYSGENDASETIPVYSADDPEYSGNSAEDGENDDESGHDDDGSPEENEDEAENSGGESDGAARDNIE